VGLLRVILAVLVVCAHMQPLHLTPMWMVAGGAIFAVKAFFIISGFYMAMVIDTRYRFLPVSAFYISRAIRILPLYWLMSLMTLAAELLLVPRGQFFHPIASPLAYTNGLDLGAMPWWIWIYMIVSVGTMIGLDTGQWLGFSRLTGDLSVFPDYGPGVTSVMAASPVPPGWSVGLELLFYAVAPFVVLRPARVIVALCAGSIAFRYALAAYGLAGNPWDRALFPSELVFFLMGVLAYRIYLRIPSLALTRRTEARLALMVLVIALAYQPLYHFSRHSSSLLDSVIYVLVAAGMPFLFTLSKDSSLDASIGNLSYPIYISHVFTLGLIRWTLPNLSTSIGIGWVWLALHLLCVMLLALALDRFIAAPIDRLRQRFGGRSRSAQVAFRPARAPAGVPARQ
jgi:peptidoglycan/LPS O-acetylase OafA/YrhL